MQWAAVTTHWSAIKVPAQAPWIMFWQLFKQFPQPFLIHRLSHGWISQSKANRASVTISFEIRKSKRGHPLSSQGLPQSWTIGHSSNHTCNSVLKMSHLMKYCFTIWHILCRHEVTKPLNLWSWDRSQMQMSIPKISQNPNDREVKYNFALKTVK